MIKCLFKFSAFPPLSPAECHTAHMYDQQQISYDPLCVTEFMKFLSSFQASEWVNKDDRKKSIRIVEIVKMILLFYSFSLCSI